MRKWVVFSIMSTAVLYGGLLDFRTLEDAKEAYANQQYTEAAALYSSIGTKNDDLHYNLGDAYYKAKKYEEALKEFEQVHSSELRAKALHNIGNSYANTQKIDEAIAAYEAALKLGEDDDTRFNLELLKKKKEEQQKQDQQQNDQQQDQQNNDQKQQDQKDQNNQQKQDQQPKNQDGQNSDDAQQQDQDKNGKSQEDQKQKEQQVKEQEAKAQQAKEDQKSDEEKTQEEQSAMKEGEPKEEPISAMQERKYEKMLDKRGIKTLMVPLKTEGGPHEETTDW